MAINSNAARIQVQSSAKNGTLLAQVGLNANQVLLDTTIAVNNGNLSPSPVLTNRYILLRQGLSSQEENWITDVDIAGTKITCAHDWVVPPALGDTYDISYMSVDYVTVTGCSFDSGSQETVFTRKLQIGQAPTTFAYAGAGNHETIRMSDEGADEALEITSGASFTMGTSRGVSGATLIFTHDGDGEICIQTRSSGTLNAYKSILMSARASSGVNLVASVIAGGKLNWSEATLVGITGPINTKRGKLKNFQNVEYLTKAELMASVLGTGWLRSEADESILSLIDTLPDDARVIIAAEY